MVAKSAVAMEMIVMLGVKLFFFLIGVVDFEIVLSSISSHLQQVMQLYLVNMIMVCSFRKSAGLRIRE